MNIQQFVQNEIVNELVAVRLYLENGTYRTGHQSVQELSFARPNIN